MLPVPDKYGGKVLMVRSVTSLAFNLDNSGNRGFVVRPGAHLSLSASGSGASYTPWVTSDDTQYTNELTTTTYRQARCVGMCVEAVSTAPTSSAVPELRYWCTPNLTTASRTASGTGYLGIPFKSLVTRDPTSIGWCPRGPDDFVPWVLNTDWSSWTSSRVDGSLTGYVPDIHLDIIGGTANAAYMLCITRVFECFLQPQFELRSDVLSPVNTAVVEATVNVAQQVHMDHSGEDLASKVTHFADQVGRIVSSPAVLKLVEMGQRVLPGLIAALA